MTSREIVKRCIEFRDPPRIGLHFKTLPIDGRVWNETDFALVEPARNPSFVPSSEGADEWGICMESLDEAGANMGETKDPPLGEGWHQLETYRFPDCDVPARYTKLAEDVARYHEAGLYVYAPIPALMLLPVNLRGMENWFADQALEQDSLCRLLDRIVTVAHTMIHHYAEAGVDGVITWDDMGTNDRPLVSPVMFRHMYFPRYKSICDLLHEHDMHFIHHCCGQVRQYMDMFIEAGCDVLQLDQPNLMGIDWLGRNYGGKICFWNPVDIQSTMPRNDPAAIAAEAHEQVWKLGNFGGGFMVKAYEQPCSVRISVEQSETQYQAFAKHSRYPLVPYLDDVS